MNSPQLSSSFDPSSLLELGRKTFHDSVLQQRFLSFSLTVTLASGIPTEFTFNGRVEIGRDCQGADDFKLEGRCFSGEALVGISANSQGQYIYGELSPVTIGKILRMLGSKLQLPPAVEQSGFPKGLIVSTSVMHAIHFLQGEN